MLLKIKKNIALGHSVAQKTSFFEGMGQFV